LILVASRGDIAFRSMKAILSSEFERRVAFTVVAMATPSVSVSLKREDREDYVALKDDIGKRKDPDASFNTSLLGSLASII
jgi:hypothetical protein